MINRSIYLPYLFHILFSQCQRVSGGYLFACFLMRNVGCFIFRTNFIM